MQREPVDSSNIDSIGYDAGERILEVEFRNGGVYRYLDVPEEIYTALNESASVGSFLFREIKGVFECEPV